MEADRKLIPWLNVVGFVLVLIIAWRLDWQTTDLAWSLWLGSLLLGTLTFVVTAIAALVFVAKLLRPRFNDRHIPKWQTVGGFGVAVVIACAFLAFFCFHFCGFHSIHAVFLSFIFPLTENSKPDDFGDFFSNPIGLFKAAAQKVFPLYSWFLLPALIVEFRKIFSPLWLAIKTKVDPEKYSLERMKKEDDRPEWPFGDPIFGPYKNVIRMHLLIFFFMGCHFLKVENFIVYAVVYAVYFFPWEIFKRKKSAAAEVGV